MAVDDAKPTFLGALQAACINRIEDICFGREGVAPPSEVVDCLHFETQRGINFLEVAAHELPASFEGKGFVLRLYEGQRADIFKNVEELKKSPKPQSIETAVQQFVVMSAAALNLFGLAGKTQTPLEAHVAASFDDH